MILKIGSRMIRVASFKEASEAYDRARGTKPASAFPEGRILDANNAQIARVSYNARVWHGSEWHAGDTPAYDPAKEG